MLELQKLIKNNPNSWKELLSYLEYKKIFEKIENKWKNFKKRLDLDVEKLYTMNAADRKGVKMIEIKNTQVYGLHESIKRSKYPMEMGEPDWKDLTSNVMDQKKTASKLGSCKLATGHDCFTKGIIIQCDIRFPLYWLKQWQRYSFANIISSQSTMHTILKRQDILIDCNKWVDQEIIEIVNRYIHAYNNFEKEIERLHQLALASGAKTLFEDVFHMEMVDKITLQNKYCEVYHYNKEDLFMKIISNLPSGFTLWMAVSFNYLQAKTIYFQRKNHKLKEWQYFCYWLEKLPMFAELILNGKRKFTDDNDNIKNEYKFLIE